ncbi:MAG: transglutaminase family protein [Chitinophagaceae bacterium]
MTYQVKHTTSYTYGERVGVCQNVALLTPRDTPTQRCLNHALIISPEPQVRQDYLDVFGNQLTYFSIEEEHESLSVTAIFTVENNCEDATVTSTSSISWENVRQTLDSSDVEILQFCYPTDITTANDGICAYADISFTPNRPCYDAVKDLMHRIFRDFKFKSGFTTVASPPSEVMRLKGGVCQDFAHLALACVRSKGLPARYVSGYIETIPPKGQKKLVGADATHAWFSVYIPGMGWCDFDPTNDKIPNRQHITTGWGRDYFDIVPLKGVLLGNGEHTLKVEVDVQRV